MSPDVHPNIISASHSPLMIISNVFTSDDNLQCMDGMEKWNVYIEYEIGNNNYIKIYKMAKHPVSIILPAEQVKILVLNVFQ